jgi:hypothetical protein
MTNYNEGGVQYDYYVQNSAQAIGGYMPEPAVTALLNLTIALQKDASDQANHTWISEYLGTVHHLEGFLSSVESIVDQLAYLRGNLLSPEPSLQFPKLFVKKRGHQEPYNHPPALIGISTKKLEIEVETLLLKGAGTLERVAQLVNSQLGLGGVRYFKGIGKLLEARAQVPQCRALLNVIAETTPTFNKTILSDASTKDCLRNAIAHRASSPELMEKGFSVNWLPDGSLLAFDAELDGIPLLASVRDLAISMPYLTLQCIKTLLESAPATSHSKAWSNGHVFSMQIFDPPWTNPFLFYSSWIDANEQGPLVSLVRWSPGGFMPHQKHLRPDVLNMAVTPTTDPRGTP